MERLQPDANFSSLPFDFSDAWIGVLIEDFKAILDFEVALTPSLPTNEIEIPLIGSGGLSLPLQVKARPIPLCIRRGHAN